MTGRDRAAAGLEMAKAGLREVNVHLTYLDIVAPADGLVARRMVEPGDMANPGMPLVVAGAGRTHEGGGPRGREGRVRR